MSVVANGSTSSSVNGSNEPLTVTEATAGSTVHWTDVIWNTGNDTETYQLTLSRRTSRPARPSCCSRPTARRRWSRA